MHESWNRSTVRSTDMHERRKTYVDGRPRSINPTLWDSTESWDLDPDRSDPTLRLTESKEGLRGWLGGRSRTWSGWPIDRPTYRSGQFSAPDVHCLGVFFFSINRGLGTYFGYNFAEWVLERTIVNSLIILCKSSIHLSLLFWGCRQLTEPRYMLVSLSYLDCLWSRVMFFDISRFAKFEY